MRLIDADDFGNRMYHEVFEKDSEDQKWDSGCWMRYKLFERVLRAQPTIEPMRKKGKWVSDDAIFGGVPYHCNQCGEKTLNMIMGKPRWNFCPMCGARMLRGETE